jgi:hypothetical protein
VTDGIFDFLVEKQDIIGRDKWLRYKNVKWLFIWSIYPKVLKQ